MNHAYVAVEDDLSFAVGTRLIAETWGGETHVDRLSRGGFGYLQANFGKFAELARHQWVLMITDLDSATCAPSLRAEWTLGVEIPRKLLFRVAVREVEAWLMADRGGLASYLGISPARLPPVSEAVSDPKGTLIQCCRRAKRTLREAIVPSLGSRAKQGLGYNGALIPFVRDHWSIESASPNSDSLSRAILRLREAMTS